MFTFCYSNIGPSKESYRWHEVRRVAHIRLIYGPITISSRKILEISSILCTILNRIDLRASGKEERPVNACKEPLDNKMAEW